MNIFDGNTGHSDGKSDGPSATIKGDGSGLNIYVGGTFDTCTVTLEKYSPTKKAFYPTEGVWIGPNEFQNLVVKTGEEFRLNIDRASGTTNIFAEVS